MAVGIGRFFVLSAGSGGLVLALDTSADVAGVAVARLSGVIASGAKPALGRQVEELAPLIKEVMAEAGEDFSSITDLVCAVGPGPYTSLRVGVMTAQAIAAAVGAKAHGVCTHDVLASQMSASDDLVTITQARRREPAFSAYSSLARVAGPEIAALIDIEERFPKAQFVATIDIGFQRISPDPAVLANYFLDATQGRSVRGVGLLDPLPIYLRPADVREPIDLRGKALRAAINQ